MARPKLKVLNLSDDDAIKMYRFMHYGSQAKALNIEDASGLSKVF